MNNKTSFSVLELKQLLIDILEHGPNVCVRFRQMGELWQQHMVRVVTVTDSRVLVHDEVNDKLISIEIQNIIQFETDNKFKVIEPYFHYTVVLDQYVNV